MTVSKDQIVSLFDYQSAFSRNLGWLTELEQKRISEVRIGLVGLGGVGGQYAEALTRLGICHFVIYDGDQFSMENSNRQNECRTSNYGKNKAQVIRNLILDINPLAKVTIFTRHMNADDVKSFCESIDIYIDSLDFFEVDLRMLIFREMRRHKKTSLTAAPMGTGSSCVVFSPDSMSFDDYFGFHRSQNVVHRSYMFLLGVSPSLQQIKYLQSRGRVNFDTRKVPSLPMGVYSCASVVTTTVLKIVLQRGKVYKAPWSVHYDPYLSQIKKTYLWWGYRNPLQALKYQIVKRILKG